MGIFFFVLGVITTGFIVYKPANRQRPIDAVFKPGFKARERAIKRLKDKI